MGKILYVEDKPDSAVIIKIFNKYLSEDEKKLIKESENDRESIYAALKENPCIEMITDFPDAISRFDNQSIKDYEMLIVDRNLSESNYSKIGLDERIIKKFTNYQREGDYLLYLAIKNKYDIESKFFYLTGNYDDIRKIEDEAEFSMIPDDFKQNNLIKKEGAWGEKLIKLFSQVTQLTIRAENRQFIKVLERNFTKDLVSDFVILIEYKDNPLDITRNLTAIRNIFENLLRKVVKILKIPIDAKVRYKNEDSKPLFDHGTLVYKRCITYLNDNKNIGFNELLHSFSRSIYTITSEFGVHKESDNISALKTLLINHEPTTNTVNSLLYALKDIILWFDKVK